MVTRLSYIPSLKLPFSVVKAIPLDFGTETPSRSVVLCYPLAFLFLVRPSPFLTLFLRKLTSLHYSLAGIPRIQPI